MKKNTIQLPPGHDWKENVLMSQGSITAFSCPHCEATFVHDGIDGSCEFEDDNHNEE